ncbi:MAG: ferredoxin reductase [Mycobacterium sp.]|nr:ferredoxin reductase [Mycobacterium sp.]
MKIRAAAALRAVTAPLTTPLLPDDYLKLLNPLWSARELRGRIVEVRREAEDSATLVIKTGWGCHFDHQAGQYIGIGLLIDGRWRWRSYSLTSVPRSVTSDRNLTITVKAMPEGFVSGHLVGGVAPGTVVRLAAPQGNFVMPDPPPPSVLFITAGSGITPVLSMLRTMERRNQIGAECSGSEQSEIVHLHSAPTTEFMFADELKALGASHSGYRLTVRATQSAGRLDITRLDAVVPDWRQRETWVCGPEGLLAAAERHWTAEGLADKLHVERFAAARSGTGRGGTVSFLRSGRSRAADAATTLLEAGEAAGVSLPAGCRMGICHTCIVTLVDGIAVDLRTGARHEPGTRVQTCVCAADGDCGLDI